MLQPAITNKTKPFLITTLILSLGAIGLLNTISQALPAHQIAITPEIEVINLDTKKEIKATIENLNKVDPQKPTITKLEKKSKGEVISNNNNLKVSIKSDRTISMDNGRNKINLKVDNHGEDQEIFPLTKGVSVSKTDRGYQKEEYTKPKLVDDKVIYQGTKVDTIVEAIDGGIRQTINIKDPTAPKVYNFPMELQKDQRIVINPDGSANVLNAKGESITTILKPWARDSDNKDLKTFYTVDKIDKNILQQHIVTNDMTRYPVKADPIFCGQAISYINWIMRDGIWSVSVTPTWCGSSSCVYNNGWACWQEVIDKTPICARYSGRTCVTIPWDKRWNTNQYWSMFNQFVCHVDIARFIKTPWNLEPIKTDKGYWGFYWNQCN